MDKSTHEIRIEHWKEVVRLCQSRPDGQTAKDWLASNGINPKKYYYWLRQIRLEEYRKIHSQSLPAEQEVSDVSFAEIRVPDEHDADSEDTPGFTPDAIESSESIKRELSNSLSPELLTVILKEVNHAG